MTTAAVARIEDAAPLAIQPGQEIFTAKQQAALAVLGIRDASNAELAVFMHYCQKTQLDPFSRQIYYIKRRERVGSDWVDKWTIQVGIDGFRVMRDRVAQRTGSVAEFEDTTWFDGDGNERKVWLSAEPPAACQVVLVKHDLATGRALRFPAVLRTASYMQVNKEGQPVSQWRTQADHMIEKCCEAFATRRAYPNDFSGVYLEEEMQGRTAENTAPPAPVRRVTAGEVIGRGDPAPDPVAKPEPSDDIAGQDARPVTAQDVNDQFRRLGFGPRDVKKVLAVAGTLADRKLAGGALAEFTGDQLAEVHARLAGCRTQDDLGELLAKIAESRGDGGDGGSGG